MRLSSSRRVLIAAAIVLSTTACGGQSNKPLNELARAHTGSLDVVMLAENDALSQGKGTLVLEFRDAGGKPVDVGAVKINATMTMPGMAPMFGDGVVTSTATKGRYDVATDLSMAGTWRFNVAWDGPAGKGSVSMPGTAR